MGHYLIRASAPVRSDAILVLAGDDSGSRLETAARLVRDGLAPFAFVSGPREVYGRNEADLAIDMMLAKGYPRSYFKPIYHQSDSTKEEAAVFCGIAKQQGIHTLMVITSNFHTRRGGNILNRTCPGLAMPMVSAPYAIFDPDSWWKSRPGRKLVYMEWTKTIADWFGI